MKGIEKKAPIVFSFSYKRNEEGKTKTKRIIPNKGEWKVRKKRKALILKASMIK